MLIALARSRGEGNSAVMMATIAATAPAPASPWMKRATMSSPCESASPHAAEASVNPVTPMRKIRRRPMRSPSRPASSRKLPKVMR